MTDKFEIAMALPSHFLPKLPDRLEEIKQVCREFGIPCPDNPNSKDILRIGYTIHAKARLMFAEAMLNEAT